MKACFVDTDSRHGERRLGVKICLIGTSLVSKVWSRVWRKKGLLNAKVRVLEVGGWRWTRTSWAPLRVATPRTKNLDCLRSEGVVDENPGQRGVVVRLTSGSGIKIKRELSYVFLPRLRPLKLCSELPLRLASAEKLTHHRKSLRISSSLVY